MSKAEGLLWLIAALSSPRERPVNTEPIWSFTLVQKGSPLDTSKTWNNYFSPVLGRGNKWLCPNCVLKFLIRANQRNTQTAFLLMLSNYQISALPHHMPTKRKAKSPARWPPCDHPDHSRYTGAISLLHLRIQQSHIKLLLWYFVFQWACPFFPLIYTQYCCRKLQTPQDIHSLNIWPTATCLPSS